MNWRRITLFLGIAYFLSLSNDGPLNFDTIIFGLDYWIPAEILFHIGILFFLALAADTALSGEIVKKRTKTIALLVILAFLVTSSEDMIPMGTDHYLFFVIGQLWFPFIIATNAISFCIMLLALALAEVTTSTKISTLGKLVLLMNGEYNNWIRCPQHGYVFQPTANLEGYRVGQAYMRQCPEKPEGHYVVSMG